MEKIIREIMSDLIKKESIFYSEADFQHQFAWQFHLRYPDSVITLEKPIPSKGTSKREYCDIYVEHENKIFFIELKYKTKKTKWADFLKNQSAQDCGRYDFIKDLARLEEFIGDDKKKIGYALLLTNDQLYWNPGKTEDTIDRNFRLHPKDKEGIERKIGGEMAWDNKTSPGTKENREKVIKLKNSYPIKWEPFIKNKFEYLLIEVV